MVRYALYVDKKLSYPANNEMFRPDQAYPEYPFDKKTISHSHNTVYAGVRDLFRVAGLDSKRFGSDEWNPLGTYIHSGDRVLVKPNLVMDQNMGSFGTDCLYTNPAVIAAVIDYIVVALSGKGRIVLADAPMQSCNWDALIEQSGLLRLCQWYRAQGVDISLVDLRGLHSVATPIGLKQKFNNHVRGTVIDLGQSSSFANLSHERIDSLRITNYDPRELKRHHTDYKHEYYISSELLEANVVVNLPKAKTHRKAGVTGALKNMVGINVRKEYLPHHSNGAKENGFDGYVKNNCLFSLSDKLLDSKNQLLTSGWSVAMKPFGFLARGLRLMGSYLKQDHFEEGGWFGNDTIWRTVTDLNKIVFYADRVGVMRKNVQRRMIVICDMVTIGQGEGPLFPEPGDWRMLSFSDDPVVHDVGMARMLGTDESLIPIIHNSLCYQGIYPWGSPDALKCVCQSNDCDFNGVKLPYLNSSGSYKAKPSSGWIDHFVPQGF